MYIGYDFDEIIEILSQKMECKDMTREQFERMIPKSVDRQILNDFYLKTGLIIRHLINDEAGEKTLRFDRLGAFPEWDIGPGAYLFASGEYAKQDRDIELDTHIVIEETAQWISQTEDGKNYIIVPRGVELFECNDDYDIDDENEDNNNFYGIDGLKVKEGINLTNYFIPITSY